MIQKHEYQQEDINKESEKYLELEKKYFQLEQKYNAAICSNQSKKYKTDLDPQMNDESHQDVKKEEEKDLMKFEKVYDEDYSLMSRTNPEFDAMNGFKIGEVILPYIITMRIKRRCSIKNHPILFDFKNILKQIGHDFIDFDSKTKCRANIQDFNENKDNTKIFATAKCNQKNCKRILKIEFKTDVEEIIINSGLVTNTHEHKQ